MQSKRFTTVIYFFSFISVGLIGGALGPSLPSFAANTGSSLKQLSNLFIFSSLGFVMGSFMAGRLLHSIPGHRILALAIVTMIAGVVLLPVINILWVLVLVFFLLGIAQSNLDVSENTLIIWLHGKNVAPYMNGLHFFFGLGSFMAPLIVAQSLSWTNTITAGFWFMAFLILLPLPFLLHLPSPANPEHNPDHTHNQKQASSSVVIVLLILLFFGVAGAEVTFGNWIYTYSLTGGFGNAQQSAYLNSGFWATFTAARLLGIFISRQITARTMIWIDLFGSAVAMLLLLFFPSSGIMLWAGVLICGLFMATTFPTALNLAERLGATSGKITSLFFISSSVSSMISPWVVGQFIENHGIGVLPWAVLVNQGIAILFLAFITLKYWKQTSTISSYTV
jgi:FHS family Na+ dependent glucose MFS transporter 1